MAAWSGAATLGLEVLWARMFSMVHENSLYSFAVVVAVFLLGLAGGAALARHLLGRGQAPERILAWTWSAAGLLVLASPRLFYAMTGGFDYVPATGGLASLGRLLLVAALTMFPACLGLGTALPVLMEMSGSVRDRRTGAMLGQLLGVNTAAAIAGPLLITFLVAPALGLWRSVALLGALTFLLGQSRALVRAERVAAWVTLAAVFLVLWPMGLPPVRVRASRGETLVSTREGTYGTAAVIEDAHDRWMTVNNSYVLGGTAAMGEERWQAHLPLLIHPNARHVAFIGLGTGITAGAARLHSAERLVALEIVPEVVEAAREDFARENQRILDDPRVRVVVDDGRAYLASPPQTFDVIVGDLLVPWRPAEAALYTQEHFEAVHRALAPGGLFCQWLPVYQLSEEQLVILLRTFADVFPAATLWRGNFLPDAPVLALVGHGQGWDLAAVDRQAATLAAKVDEHSPFLRHPMGTWLFFVGSLRSDALTETRRNREGEPWVELLSRKHGSALVGRHLESLLERVSADGQGGLRLDTVHREWTEIGRRLATAATTGGSLGERQVLAILQTLPPELRTALAVEAP
jgi:spermidine synthase